MQHAGGAAALLIPTQRRLGVEKLVIVIGVVDQVELMTESLEVPVRAVLDGIPAPSKVQTSRERVVRAESVDVCLEAGAEMANFDRLAQPRHGAWIWWAYL